MKNISKTKIALVIGSGGIKCAAAIGMWKVFQEEGIDRQISLIVGCSGGSLYAAVIALGMSAEEMEEATYHFWTQKIMKDYTAHLKAIRSGEMRFNETSGLVDDSYLNSVIAETFGGKMFSDLSTPLRLVATELFTGEEVVLSKGKISDAVRASLAIPIIFPPWEIDERLLIDGAASAPLPVDVAMKAGGEIIVAMGFKLPYRKRMHSMTAVQSQLNSIYMNNILKSNYAFHNLAHYAEILPIIPDFDEEFSMFDTEKLPEIIAKGEESARSQLPHLETMIKAANI